MADNAGLVVTDLQAGYGRREVLRSISFTLRPGQVTVLLGANGAGKSTTCKAVIGAVKTTAGTVTGPDGKPVSREPSAALKQGVALVPEGGRVFGDFTVEDPELLANALYASGLGALQLARVGILVKEAAPGVPKVAKVSPDQVKDYLVASALALAAGPR